MTSARTPEFNPSYSIGDSINVGALSPAPGAALELDSQFAQQTKSQITRIVAEIGELSRHSRDRLHFYSEFLPRILTAMGGIGAALWQSTESGKWRLLASQSLPIELLSSDKSTASTELHIDASDRTSAQFLDGLPRNEADSSSNRRQPSDEHQRLMSQLLIERQPVLVPPRGIAVGSQRPTNPIEQLLVFSPIPFDSPEGSIWIEVVQRPSGGPATQRGYLRFVAQMADLAADFLKTLRLRELEQERTFLQHAEQLLQRIAASSNRSVAFRDLADTLRSVNQAGQVFIVHRPGRRRAWQVVAASGLDEVDQRGEGVLAIDRLAMFAYHSAQASCENWNAKSQTGQDSKLDHFFQLFGASQVTWTPVLGCNPNLSAVGVAVIQTWDSPIPTVVQHSRTVSLTQLALSAIRPNWLRAAHRLTKATPITIHDCLFPNRWPQAFQVTAASLLVACVGMLPVPIRINAPSTLHPNNIKILYAQADGIVRQVAYDHGDIVQDSNRVLMIIENPEFDEKVRKAKGDLESLQAELQFRDSESNNPTRAPEYRIEQGIRRALLEKECEAKSSQIAVLDRFVQDKLTVTADSESIIGSWRLKELMTNRPVHAGDVVAILYPKNAKWLAEAEIPESENQLLQSMRSSASLPNSRIILKSNPSQRLDAVYSSMDSQFVPSSTGDGTQVLRVQYELHETSGLELKDGLTGHIQIDCNRQPLAWAVFRDAIRSIWTTLKLWI